MTELAIRTSAYDGAEAAALVAALDADLDRRYGAGDPVHAEAGQFQAPTGRFLLASDGSVAVGCAGVRRLDEETAELKRMFVAPEARGRGVARALLSACEQAAAEMGYRRLWLETGLAQPEAIALYTSSGYEPVRRFGQYADSPTARYFGRELTAASTPSSRAPLS